jgi:anti-sigma regulatory factor (Ser/Thr protein kinase)/nucleoid DNA-binding protein
MEIIVKKDILDELQAKGLCLNREEADKFLQTVITEIAEGIGAGNKIVIDSFGSFWGERQDKEIEITGAMIASNKLNLDKNKLQKMVATLFHFIKDMLLRGHEVHLLDFASFRIEEKKALLAKLASGQRNLMPARKVLLFTPEEKLLELTDSSLVNFAASEEFHKLIARLKSSCIVLVVPMRDFFVKTFAYHFEKNGWKVHTLQSVEEAKQIMDGGNIFLLIVDSQVENYQSLCEQAKCGKNSGFIPLVVMYPKGTDAKKLQGFRICGDESLIQPFEIKQLIALAESVLRKTAEEKTIFKQEVMFQLQTGDQYIEKTIELCNRLFNASGLDEEGQLSMAAGFREALTNAAQHGNKHRRDKMLEVLYLLDKEKITVAVTDSGSGFDWQKYMRTGESADPVNKARQSHKEGKLGGLGIMLMLRCVDKVEYNSVGNSITLTKYIMQTKS